MDVKVLNQEPQALSSSETPYIGKLAGFTTGGDGRPYAVVFAPDGKADLISIHNLATPAQPKESE